MALYGYPEMGRFGLAHSLLAWARCVIWCEQTGATMLAPRWFRIRIGPYIRKERDKREYFKLFNQTNMIGEPYRSWLLLTANKYRAIDGYFTEIDLKNTWQFSNKNKSHLVIFNNANANNEVKHFHEVYGHSKLLKSKLTEITKPKYLPKVNIKNSIAIHIRLGDFSQQQTGNTIGNNTRLPIEWYINVLSRIREQTNKQIPAIIYSDGSDSEISSILNLPSVTRASKNESITDILSISDSLLLIASGSGFSRWAAFLGQKPIIAHPGKKEFPILDRKELEIENDGKSSLPKCLIEYIESEISNIE